MHVTLLFYVYLNVFQLQCWMFFRNWSYFSVRALTRSGRWSPLAALWWRGEAALGPPAAPSAQADPRAFGRDDGPRQRRRRGDARRVRVHSGTIWEKKESETEIRLGVDWGAQWLFFFPRRLSFTCHSSLFENHSQGQTRSYYKGRT